MLASAEDQIVRCFSKNISEPDRKLHRFYGVIVRNIARKVVAALEGHILLLVSNFLEGLKLGIGVLNLGCSRGHILNKLVFLFPNSQFTGIEDYIVLDVISKNSFFNYINSKHANKID